MRPHFGHVEDIRAVSLGFLRTHQLNIDIPNRKVTFLDRLKHILNHIIRVLPSKPRCLLASKVFDSLLCLHMNLGVLERSVLEATQYHNLSIFKMVFGIPL